MGWSRYICMAVALCSLQAQVAEPILSKSALPFGIGAGSVKLDYVGAIGPEGGNSQLILKSEVRAPLWLL
jgi:hypothetical protein